MNILERKIAGHCQFYSCMFIEPLKVCDDKIKRAGLYSYMGKDGAPTYHTVSHKKIVEIIDIYEMRENRTRENEDEYRELLFELQYLSPGLFTPPVKAFQKPKEMAAVMLPEPKK